MSLDFLRFAEKSGKKGDDGVAKKLVFPDFQVVRSSDLMLRGKTFYAIWDDKVGLWSTDEFDVQRLVDDELWELRRQRIEKGETLNVLPMKEFSSGAWKNFRSYLAQMPDSSIQLDESLTFANTEIKKENYASKKLPYSLEEGDYSAWTELVSTLYDPTEQEKIEWMIGSVVSGDSKHLQKLFVFYGPPGSGKSTILNIIGEKLFPGYTSAFVAKDLTGSNNSFAMEAFRSNPLVSIEHDGDLSQIRDYTKLNSIVSHEWMTMNEKFKSSYDVRILALLIMGTNSPVKISDAKAGIIRRLVDIHPSGRLLAGRKYHQLMKAIDSQLGAIAQHCLEVYREKGKDYFEKYRAVEMMLQTDPFYNYIENFFDVFKEQDGVTLDQAYSMYRQFCDDSEIDQKHRIARYKFREELRNYFEEFHERYILDGLRVRSYYEGFKIDKFNSSTKVEEEPEEIVDELVIDQSTSIFDTEFADCPAQYGTKYDTPKDAWDDVTTILTEIDTSQVHYVRVPENHIVIDFDLTDENGEKSAEKNLEAARTWPATYAEFSKGGGGIHLHYNYTGDVDVLSRLYSPGIEVKVFKGKSALRRRLSFSNNVPVASISSGLPLKEKKVLSSTHIQSERGLRDLIERHMNKEIMHATKPSIDMIKKVLDENREAGLQFDVSDLQYRLIAMANNSTNQPLQALKVVMSMNFKSEGNGIADIEQKDELIPDSDRNVFFDVEVYKNLFMICWKYEDDDTIITMINPKPHEVEQLFRLKLIGFNNRRYDNHMLLARSMGYSNMDLYNLSQKIIEGQGTNAMFPSAYELSYADIYDFSSKKQSLKKFEAELGLTHIEMEWDWNEPIPEEMWDQVAEYCGNDVLATEATFKDRRADFIGRQILADISGLSVNASTNSHTARIIFEGDKKAADQFVYTDLSEMFEGYTFERGKSSYRDEDPGSGGYVYAEPGIYYNVGLYDVASMHPNSIIQLNLFGKYTKNFKDLIDARVAIKRGQFDEARKLYGGRLKPYLVDESVAKDLSYALKIAINIVYGMTSASFTNPFKDPRNKDNIVAKRGALFMIDLKHAVQELGYTVIHIKTDSIKIANADDKVKQFIFEFGEKYGYEFEHEATYDKLALTTKADYVAFEKDHWTATGATFQRPFVFKTLFSHEPIEFEDMCEVKQVTSKMYLDFTEGYASEAGIEKELRFVGKVGVFTPIKEGAGGGILVREKDDKYHAVTGTKDWRFMESHIVKELGKEDDIDMDYFRAYVDGALKDIGKFGDAEAFVGH